ncbi:MAG: TrkA family potassium uptake protein [Eubacteriales bacterium]|nr:TrkA family potassium uptake protein [Eubacteriales bacterium]
MKSFLVIGLGRFGRHLCMRLNELDNEIMAVDTDENRVNAVLPYVTNAQIGDCTNEEFLRSLGVDNYDICFVAIGDDFQSSLEITSLLKDLGAREVVSRATKDVQEKFLLRNGADEVVYPEREVAEWTAVKYASEHILNYVELDDNIAIFETDIPESWMGRTVADVDVRKNYGINIVAIKHNGELILNIKPDNTFNSGDTLLVVGENDDIRRTFNTIITKMAR